MQQAIQRAQAKAQAKTQFAALVKAKVTELKAAAPTPLTKEAQAQASYNAFVGKHFAKYTKGTADAR